jgi:hypothetical protein
VWKVGNGALTARRIIGADRIRASKFPFSYQSISLITSSHFFFGDCAVMLRSSIAPGRQLLSNPVRQRIPSQWLSKAGASNRLAGQVERPYSRAV